MHCVSLRKPKTIPQMKIKSLNFIHSRLTAPVVPLDLSAITQSLWFIPPVWRNSSTSRALQLEFRWESEKWKHRHFLHWLPFSSIGFNTSSHSQVQKWKHISLLQGLPHFTVDKTFQSTHSRPSKWLKAFLFSRMLALPESTVESVEKAKD